ncbi:signal transduction histidine kinase [Rhizobium soli]|uniref:histidine kinase n=1 Tax=Rhizobium soli TaxID=424798 RepID=A0A7X0JQ84_9HYPH|nr:sensor histidine kinase [Rhizobium soli]MBB6510912.1 signal transduction histidine kinase [Rhizobium soli]
MTFTVAARTLLHLGSELISSDGIAFYELIKNGLDALRDLDGPQVVKAKAKPIRPVKLDIVCRVDFSTYEHVLRGLGVWSSVTLGSTEDLGPDDEDMEEENDDDPVQGWRELRSVLVENLDESAPGSAEFLAALKQVSNADELSEIVLEANYIEVIDEGVGMSFAELGDVFLKIGTTSRVRQRDRERIQGSASARPILGEKGLGRLSAMRLGDRLSVKTGREADARWNLLNVDWMMFAAAGDAALNTISVEPALGLHKEIANLHGTTIRISALKSGWTYDKLEAMAASEFAKLADPFDAAGALPIKVTFNSRNVPIPKFSDFIFSHAHGVLNARFFISKKGNPILRGQAEYRLRKRTRSFRLRGIDLASITDSASKTTLKRVGPFKLEVYWFNRRLLSKIDGIGDLKQVRALIERWGGGVMVFRDGFRVHPYGGPEDDWLDLDRDAFSTSGFKVNRGQIVGKVDITHEGNPFLVDQTNREGLRDSPEKAAFVSMIASIMDKQFRQFLNSVDADIKQADKLTLTEVTSRVDSEDLKITETLKKLAAALPKTKEAAALSQDLKASVDAIKQLNLQVRATAETYDRERMRVIHLAGVGLMVEVLAHELWRATASSLRTITAARSALDPSSITRSLAVLDAQMRTLQKRLKTLDPLSTNARQVKENFDVVEWVRTVVTTFTEQARRENIRYVVTSIPPNGRLPIEAVKGMYVQVIENLLINSAYWIEQQKKYTGVFEGQVEVVVDCNRKTISVMDNGPGIPADRREVIFEPFFSTKPKKEGRGLGLYISKEIAEYHGGRLYLSPEPDRDGQLRKFIYEIEASGEADE